MMYFHQKMKKKQIKKTHMEMKYFPLPIRDQK